MSGVEAATAPAASQDAPQSPPNRPSKPAYRSWRKKYYKMRHRFHGLMNQNHKRFEEEQKTIKLARRLQEQNDQLLQLLYETNQSKRLPSKLRYGIHLETKTPSISDLPTLVDDHEDSDAADLPSNPARVLKVLEGVPHSSLEDLLPGPKSVEETDRSIFDDHIGYLSPTHETEYLAAMDAFESRARGSGHETSVPNGPWSSQDSTGAALKNPVSVYNWLKKHQPNVFLDPDEKAPAASSSNAATGAASSSTPAATREEKGSSRTAPTKVQPKRASVSAKHQADSNFDDDDYAHGSESANTGSVRGKRKQMVDDDAYRPKGGSSRKRKKLSVGQTGDKSGAAGGGGATAGDSIAAGDR